MCEVSLLFSNIRVMKTKRTIRIFHRANLLCVFRRHSVQAERFPRLYPLAAAEWRHAGPGGEGKDNPRCSGRMSGSLQQLRRPLPEPGSLRGENQQLLL